MESVGVAADYREPAVQTVSTLVGHPGVDMALICLGSLIEYAPNSIRLQVHDDGTLTNDDHERLARSLPITRIISRQEADSRVSSLLRNYPACYAARARHIFGLKLFDVTLLSEDETISYCDTDILFLRRFQGLFQEPDESTSCVFSQDWQEAYALRPWHLLSKGRLMLPRKLNAGLFFLKRAVYDLSRLEEVLHRNYPTYHRLACFVEQTCWGALAWQKGVRFWNSRQIHVVQGPDYFSDKIVAAHFTSPLRHLFYTAPRGAPTRSRVQIETVERKVLTAHALLFSQIRRFIKTRMLARLLT